MSRPIRVYQIVATDHLAQPAAPGWRQRRTALIAIASVASAAMLAMVFLRSRSPAPAPPQGESAAERTISSIAVLPLDNFSGDPS